MSEYIAPLEKLIEQFRSLKGVGKKTAIRLAFSILDFSEEQVQHFADAILDAKRSIVPCRQCFNISDTDLCRVCADEKRDHSTLCVVEDAKAVMAFEKVKDYQGLYHVLHGAISPMDGIGPEQLKIKELVERVAGGDVAEVILATNPTIEGETTAMYISKLLKPFDIKVSRLAYGVPVGGELEYADEVTLFRAMEGRRNMESK
ncbi:MAG: recombination protein RecR [Clostridiales bacterium]|nr:recombination protein RecR [Clostridiales bacterium]